MSYVGKVAVARTTKQVKEFNEGETFVYRGCAVIVFKKGERYVYIASGMDVEEPLDPDETLADTFVQPIMLWIEEENRKGEQGEETIRTEQ